MKRIEITGHAGNSRTIEIVVTGSADRPVPGNAELAREAARCIYNTLPGYAWDAFVEVVNLLEKRVPYDGL